MFEFFREGMQLSPVISPPVLFYIPEATVPAHPFVRETVLNLVNGRLGTFAIGLASVEKGELQLSV